MEQKKKQYPTQYVATDFKYQFGKRVHDCVGLIKGYLWTDNGKLTYNPSQDKDVSGMKADCLVAGDIKTMPEKKGLLVFMKGHVGVYIGNGEVIEARGHAYGVVKTKQNERAWTSWGMLRWINYYTEEEIKMFDDEYKALDYLVEKGRIKDRDYWEKALSVTKNLNFLIIKWANDVRKLQE